MNTTILKFTRTLSKIVEILVWIGTGILAVVMVLSIIFKDFFIRLYNEGVASGQLTMSGALVEVPRGEDFFTVPVFLVYVTAVIGCALVAWILRDIHRIFSSDKPFTKENVALVKQVGYLAIILPALDILASVIGSIIGGPIVKVEVDLKNVIFGFVVLALSQYFQYGCQLEDEVDGLL